MYRKSIENFKIMNTMAFNGFKIGLRKRYTALKELYDVDSIPYQEMKDDVFVENYRHRTKLIYRRFKPHLPNDINVRDLTKEREAMIELEFKKMQSED